MIRRRKLVLVATGIAAALAAVLVALYLGLRHVPSFYARALRAEPARLEQASNDWLIRTGTLASDSQQAGAWKALFTEDEINGWLAVDRARNHAQFLPPTIVDPRVRLASHRAWLGFRYQDALVPVVISLEIEAYMTEPNLLSLRFHRVQAGAISLPLKGLLDNLSRQAESMNAHVQWREVDGDPVALVRLPLDKPRHGASYVLDVVQLREGAVYLAGRTQRSDSPEPDPEAGAGTETPEREPVRHGPP